MVKLGSILKSTMCQVIARNSVKAVQWENMAGRLDWRKCLGCRHVRANLAPLLLTLFSQGTIWAHAYHLCLFHSPGIFGISSIQMVWYIVCSGWKTWLIKMFEMRLRVKGDLVLLSSKSTSSYKPTQKLIKYWKSGNLILTWRNSLSFIFLDDFAHHQKSLPNVWDLCM